MQLCMSTKEKQKGTICSQADIHKKISHYNAFTFLMLHNNNIHYILTYGIALSSFAISMVVNSLGVVLEIVGSTGMFLINLLLFR